MLKKITLFISLFSTTLYFAQSSSLSVEASQNITNFDFFYSDGSKDQNYKPILTSGYSLGYRFESKQGILATAKLGKRKAGATRIYDTYNYLWDLEYLEFRLGVGYNYKFGKYFGVGALAQPYVANMIKANQVLNNQNFDIINSGDIKKLDYGSIFSVGVNFNPPPPANLITAYLDFNYMLGIANLETNSSQKSRNNLIGATFGIAFKLNN